MLQVQVEPLKAACAGQLVLRKILATATPTLLYVQLPIAVKPFTTVKLHVSPVAVQYWVVGHAVLRIETPSLPAALISVVH